jgi:CRISPR/Cas system-associated exonuclease Cas4 (RecB family)
MPRVQGAERERTIIRPAGQDTGPGELARISATQITNFDTDQDGGCPTSWWFEKVDGRPKPGIKAQAIGSEIHGQLEHFILTGEDVLGPIPRAGKHLLPQRDPRLEVEREIRTTIEGVALVGYIDLLNPTGIHVDEQGPHVDPPGTVEVLDHKTTGSISSWAKAPSALVRTVQMPLYGKVVADLFPGGEHVRLSHLYFQTKGAPKAEKRSALVPLEVIRGRWQKIESTVREMKDVAREGDVEKVPKNFNACGAYGGCPYRDVCPRPASVALATLIGKGNAMSLLAKIQGKSAQAPAAPVAVAPAAPPPAPAPVVSTVPPPTYPPAATGAKSGGLLGKITGAKPTPAPAPASPIAAVEAQVVAKIAAHAAAPAKTPAKQAKQNHIYLIDFSTGPVRAVYLCRTKGGLSFGRMDGSINQTIILEDDTLVTPTGEVYESAPVPQGAVVAPDAPKSGESGPKAEPFKPGESVPENVRKAAEDLAAEAAESVEALEGDIAANNKQFAENTPIAIVTPAPAPAEPPAPKTMAERRDEAKAERKRVGRPPKLESAQKRIAEALAAGFPPNPNDVEFVAKAEAKMAAAQAAQATPAPATPVETVQVRPAYSTGSVTVPADSPIAQEARVQFVGTAPVEGALRDAGPMIIREAEPFVLYLEAMPVRGAQASDLDLFIEDLHQAIAKQFKVEDIRFADGQSPLGFGKWKGVLAAFAKENAPASGSYFLVGVKESELRSVVAEALATKAAIVVRGVA